MATKNKLEAEILDLEKTIRTLENLIPRKDSKAGASKKLYGKAYRTANENFLNNTKLFNDKWIQGSSGRLPVQTVSTGFGVVSPNVGVPALSIPKQGIKDTRLGLGETLNALLKKREQLIKLSTKEKIDTKTIIPNEVRHLYPRSEAILGGAYRNPHYLIDYEEDSLLKARNEAKTAFYNEYGRRGRRMSPKERLAIMSQSFSPYDPEYTGTSSQLGHLGIRTRKTNLSQEEMDQAAVQNSVSRSSGSTWEGETLYGGGGLVGRNTDVRMKDKGSTSLTIHQGKRWGRFNEGDQLGVMTKNQRDRYDREHLKIG